MKRKTLPLLIVFILLVFTVSSVSAFALTAKLVGDIWGGASGSAPSQLFVFDGKLIFAANDGTSGVELWEYDGTTISQVADLNPGAASSDPADFAIYNGNLYFSADDGTGKDLWMYDGTNPPVLGYNPVLSPGFSAPAGMTIYNGLLYFAGYMYPFGYELFSTDGTTITNAADINLTAIDVDSDPYDLTVYNGNLYFQADDGINGIELWRYNGVTATLAADINPAGSSYPEYMTVYNGNLYFSADNGVTGYELWRFNGTTATPVADIFPGASSSYPEQLVVFDGKLVFVATDKTDDYELWSFDGTTTGQEVDIYEGDEGSDPYWLTLFDGLLYFAAYGDDFGYEVWSYDGTTAANLTNINPGGGSSPRFLTVYDNAIFLQADDGSLGAELWELSDTVGPTVVSTKPANGSQTADRTPTIVVVFSENVLDPAGNTDPNDVTNPNNYLLVRDGPNGAFDTTSCAAGLAGDDLAVVVNSVTYDSTNFRATLSVNDQVPLRVDRYRLIVCQTITDELDQPLNDGADEVITFTILEEALPDTGFAPGVVTQLEKPAASFGAYGDLWLEVPGLDLQMSILGVPQSAGGWDVSWLGSSAGWLEGTAFPTWAGNTVITGHVWNADGYPGPFVNLKDLQYGDILRVHAWGQVYTYEIRETDVVWSTATNAVTQHEEYDWLTLLTCEGWNQLSQSYDYRRVVRAVLVSVTAE